MEVSMRLLTLIPYSILLFLLLGLTPAKAEEVIVTTPKGKLAGLQQNGVDVFLGVPVSLPPYEKDTRLLAPRPVSPWEGVINCFQQASLPLQPDRVTTGSKDAGAKTGFKGGGDCLKVNIWAPAGKREGLPVLAYIPGGGSVRCDTGSIDGSAFARDGIIVVSIPYRPNVDGFLKLKDAPANIAIRDMIAGLEWIKENIGSFGGNPNNVTVMGQSAGATHIGSLLASPLARNLFNKAILMSGSHLAQWTPQQAEKASELASQFYGTPATREAFSALPFEKLMTFPKLAAEKLGDPEWLEFTNGNATLFKPWIDGEVLPARPVDAIAAGASKDIDVLMGSTANEWNNYIVANGVIDKLGPQDVEEILTGIKAPLDTAEKYRANGRGNTDGEIFSAIQSDIIFRVPTNRMLEARAKGGGKTWAYSFDQKSQSFGGKMGAAHASELPYVFNSLASIKNQREKDLVGPNPSQALADKMHNAWVAFIKDGNPGWQPYDPERRNIVSIIDGEWIEKEDPWKNERELIKLP